MLHKDVHAQLNPQKIDWRTRPRVFTQLVGKASSGKTVFYRRFVTSFLVGADGEHSFLETHKQLLADGGKKGLYLASATDAEFAQRVHDADGYLMWASPENYLLLDHGHAGQNKDNTEKKLICIHCLN